MIHTFVITFPTYTIGGLLCNLQREGTLKAPSRMITSFYSTTHRLIGLVGNFGYLNILKAKILGTDIGGVVNGVLAILDSLVKDVIVT